LQALAKDLPKYQIALSVRGIGLALAVRIVAEAGLSSQHMTTLFIYKYPA